MCVLMCRAKVKQTTRLDLLQAVAQDERMLAVKKKVCDIKQERQRLKKIETSKNKTSGQVAAQKVSLKIRRRDKLVLCKQAPSFVCFCYCCVVCAFIHKLYSLLISLFQSFQNNPKVKSWAQLEGELQLQIQMQANDIVSSRKTLAT